MLFLHEIWYSFGAFLPIIVCLVLYNDKYQMKSCEPFFLYLGKTGFSFPRFLSIIISHLFYSRECQMEIMLV